MVAHEGDGVSRADEPAEEHAQHGGESRPPMAVEPRTGDAEAAQIDPVERLMQMLLEQQAAMEKQRVAAEAARVAAETANAERFARLEQALMQRNGPTYECADALGLARQTGSSVGTTGYSDDGGSPGAAIAGRVAEAQRRGHDPRATNGMGRKPEV